MGRKEYKDNTKNSAPLYNLHSGEYNPIWYEEYKMMREELMNYMEKLQTVRNMMYVTIGAVFTFSISKDLPFFCILMPLFFILPAYMIAVNYWICVRKASAYLVVFHESYKDCPIHWESRHNILKRLSNKKENFNKSILKNVPSQLISYYSCAIITMLVYTLQLYKYVADKKSLDSSFDFWDVFIDGIPILAYIIIGIIVTIFLVAFFICFSMGESYDSFLKKFILIKYKEEQCEIGKGVSDDKVFKEKDKYMQDISRFMEKYL